MRTLAISLGLLAFAACTGAPSEPTPEASVTPGDRPPRDIGADAFEKKCPDLKRIDCMPMVKKEMRPYCVPGRVRWIAENCPDILITF